jgi:drug/metabolite transporter (DMT)-like permease
MTTDGSLCLCEASMPYLLFAGCCLVWSVSFLLMKKAVVGFHPITVAAWRVLGGGFVLAFLCWRRREWPRLTLQQARWLGVVCLLGCGWPYVIQPEIVARQGSAFVALAVSLVPLITLIFSAVFLGVYPSSRQLAGVCTAFVCLGVLLVDGLRRAIPLSDLLLACSVPACYSAANLVIRRQLAQTGSLGMTFLIMLITSAVLFPLSLTQTNPGCDSPRDWWLAVACLGLLGTVGTGLATYWFNTMIQLEGPLFAGMSTNLVPIGALLWGWWDAEEISARQVLALLGIVIGVVWVQTATYQRPVPIPPPNPSATPSGD